MADYIVKTIASLQQIDTPQGDFWDDYLIGRPLAYSTFYTDFYTYNPSDWTVTASTGGTIVVADEALGVLLVTNDGDDNDNTNMQLGGTDDGGTGESVLPALRRTIWYETRLNLNDVSQTDLVAGLTITDTDPVTSTTGIYFLKSDGVQYLNCVSSSSAGTSAETNVYTLTNDTYVKLGIKVINLDKVEFYINGTKVLELNTTIPAVELRPTFHIQNGEDAAAELSVDYLFVAQSR